MTPPKKMSLQEFFSDESYGGSWADEDFDMASISVPIEKHKGHGNGGYSHFGSGTSRYGSSRSNFFDNGPPYIVKLSNIPVTSNDAFITDLFHSRFTPLTKFKILFDPLSQPMELGIVKKIAFVELPSFDSQNKVAKWQDVVYKGSRRVIIEVADFNDFQHSMQFNQSNQSDLLRVEEVFLSSRPRGGSLNDAGAGRAHSGIGRPTGGMPLDSIPEPKHHFGPQLRSRGISSGESGHSNYTVDKSHGADSSLVIQPKSNPFGHAKPVDVLARQHEIEKKLIVLKHTTFTAPWVEGVHQAPLGNSQKPSALKNAWGVNNGFHGETADSSRSKKSLADILSKSKVKDRTGNTRAASSTPKTVARKPTILMKKPVDLTPAPANSLTVFEKANEETSSINDNKSLAATGFVGEELVQDEPTRVDGETYAATDDHGKFSSLDSSLDSKNPPTRTEISKQARVKTMPGETKRLRNKKTFTKEVDVSDPDVPKGNRSTQTVAQEKPKRHSNKSTPELFKQNKSTRGSFSDSKNDASKAGTSHNDSGMSRNFEKSERRRQSRSGLTDISTDVIKKRDDRVPPRKVETKTKDPSDRESSTASTSELTRMPQPLKPGLSHREDNTSHGPSGGRGGGRSRGRSHRDGRGRGRGRGRGHGLDKDTARLEGGEGAKRESRERKE